MNPEIEKIRDRMWIDPEELKKDFERRFRENNLVETESFMDYHFRVAKLKPEGFINHRKVLAISFGGSNTKIMLASMKNGQMMVEHVHALANPEEHILFEDYMDQLLVADMVIREYLDTTVVPEIGISIPMVILDDVPYHPTKMATIDGVIARTKEEITPEMRFAPRFDRYMKRHGWNDYHVFYQSDGIVAHHGAVSLTDPTIDDKTQLTIIGTGFANGDEKHYMPVAMVNSLPKDEGMYPAALTENGQLQYAVSGKGIWLVMRQAILAWNETGQSKLEGKGLENFFTSSKDSKWVCFLYSHKVNPEIRLPGLSILLEAAGDGLEELEQLAEYVMIQVYRSVGILIYLTFRRMRKPENGGRYFLYFEGSIARNPEISRRMTSVVKKMLSEWDPQLQLTEDPPLRPYLCGKGCTEQMLKGVDTTLAGAASVIMAECTVE